MWHVLAAQETMAIITITTIIIVITIKHNMNLVFARVIALFIISH